MNHPIIIAVPILMLLDYILTILGAKASAGVYRQHFKTPHFELNPRWQAAVAQLRWFNPRHLALVCIATLLAVLLDRLSSSQAQAFQLFLGMLLGAFSTVCGRHLSNLLLFWFLNRNPSEISGQVELTHRLVLRISLFNLLGLVPLLGLLAVLVPEMYIVGALLGILASAFAHFIWLRKAKSREAKTPMLEEQQTPIQT